MLAERLGTPAACTQCTRTEGVRFGHLKSQQRFRCQRCSHTFMALTGTPLLDLRNQDTFLAHAAC